MVTMRLGTAVFAAPLIVLGGQALAAPCGNNSAGFEKWKRIFSGEAEAQGISKQEIEEDMGDIEAAIIGAISEANDAEVARLAARDD